jgi:hypothetical protein
MEPVLFLLCPFMTPMLTTAINDASRCHLKIKTTGEAFPTAGPGKLLLINLCQNVKCKMQNVDASYRDIYVTK